MKSIIILLATCLLFVSCEPRGKASLSVQRGDFNVEFLFEIDSCKVYRFKDGDRYIYWSNCRGKMQYDYTTTTGKTTQSHPSETITTTE